MPLKQACSSHVTFTELPPVSIEQITGPLVLPGPLKRSYNNAKRASKAQRRLRGRSTLVIRKATGEKAVRSVRKFKTQRTKINNLVLRKDADLYFTERRNVVKTTALTPALWWGGKNCCQKNCAQWFVQLDEYSKDCLWNMRTSFQSYRSELDRREFLASVIDKTFVRETMESEQHTIQPALLGRRVCVNFFCKLMDVSSKKYTRVKLKCSKGQYQTSVQSIQNRTLTPRRVGVAAWLTVTSQLHDPLPHRQELRFCCGTKKQVYDLFLEDVKDPEVWPDLQWVNYDFFLRVWKKDIGYQSVTVRGKSTEFAKCDTCTQLNEMLSNRRLSKEEREFYHAELLKHDRLVKAERLAYEMRKREAAEKPNDILSLALDGGDQGAYGTPYFHQKTKEYDKWYKMRNYVVGVCVHNRGYPDMLFHHLPIFERGANCTIEVLNQVFTYVKEQRRGRDLPRKLFLQLDNCSRENKNKYLLAFLCDLVWKKVFDEVYISYLPKGHTHFDPDAVFSCISGELESNHALSVEELIARMKACKQPAPKVQRMHEVANISDYIDENDLMKPMVGLMQVGAIKIYRNSKKGELEDYPAVTTRVTSSNPFKNDRWSPPVFPLKAKINYRHIGNCKFTGLEDFKIKGIKKGIQQFETWTVEFKFNTDIRFQLALTSLWLCYNIVENATTAQVPFPWILKQRGKLLYEPDGEAYQPSLGAEDERDVTVAVLSSDGLVVPSSPVKLCRSMDEQLYTYKRRVDEHRALAALPIPEPISSGMFAVFVKEGFELSKSMPVSERDFNVGLIEKVFRFQHLKTPPCAFHLLKEDSDQKCVLVKWYSPSADSSVLPFQDRIFKPAYRWDNEHGKLPIRDVVSAANLIIGFNDFSSTGKLKKQTYNALTATISSMYLNPERWMFQ